MPGIIQKKGDLFEAEEISFRSDQVDLNFQLGSCDQEGRRGLAKIIVKQKEAPIHGWVWLCPNQVLEAEIGKSSFLIADQVEGLPDALRKTLGFFFS